MNSRIAVSPDGTVIAGLVGGGACVFDGNGSALATIAVDGNFYNGEVTGIAVDADGTIALVGPYSVEQGLGYAELYDDAGNFVTGVGPFGDSVGTVAFDSSGALDLMTAADNGGVVDRYSSSLTQVFDAPETFTVATFRALAPGVLATTNDEVFSARTPYVSTAGSGSVDGVLELRSPTGVLEWSQPLPFQPTQSGAFTAQVSAIAIGGGSLNRVAVTGMWDGSAYIQVYDLP